MQRHLTESFADYKARRAVANEAVKQINAHCRTGSQPSARSQRLKGSASGIKGIKGQCGTYGATLKAHFDQVRPQR